MSGVDEEEGSSFFGKLKSFYYKVEDKYYAVLDNLFEKGVDLYKYFVEPIESRGVPSFPVAIALLLVLLGGIIYGASLTLGPTTGNLTISVSGTDLDSIPVTLVIDGTDFATKDTVNRTVSFDGVPLNRQTQIKITQEGYAPVLKTVSLRSASNTETIRLSSTAVEIHDFLVTLLDSVTGQPVRDATISFESLTTGVTGTINPQSDGTAVIKLDSLDAILSLNIQSDNYEASQRSIQAHDGQAYGRVIPSCGVLLLHGLDLQLDILLLDAHRLLGFPIEHEGREFSFLGVQDQLQMCKLLAKDHQRAAVRGLVFVFRESPSSGSRRGVVGFRATGERERQQEREQDAGRAQ